MQQCPKCGSSVPDGRVQCQICGAEMDPESARTAGPTGLQNPVLGPKPLTEEEAADLRPGIPGIDRPGVRPEDETDVLAKQIGGGAAAAPQGGVELRRTLSGEVIEVPISAPPRAGGPMLGRSGPTPPPTPIPTARPGGRPTVPPLRSGAGPVLAGEGASARKSSAGIILVVIVLLILAGGAAGYWYYQQTRPAAAVTQLIEDLNKHNWGAVYDQIELPSQLKSLVTRDMFQQAMALFGSNLKIESYEITGSKIDGDKATVSVKATTSVGGKQHSSSGDVNLVRVNGVWKLDASGGAPRLPGVGAPRIPGAR